MKLTSLLRFVPLLAAAMLPACKKSADTAAPAPPPVTVAHPVMMPVTENMDLTGTVAASQTVDLVARVPGYLKSVNFADGSLVESNQLLFVIEPDPYEQQLKAAQAGLLRAQSELDRQQELVAQNATSVANVEKWHSERDQADAQVSLAKINLGYTRVTAPFSGRIGRHLVDAGNMVGIGGNTKLATLNQMSPIYVYFNLNERDALRIRDAMRQLGMQPQEKVGKAPVLVGLQNEDGWPHQGTLDFLDNGASTSTGTIQMRVALTNEDNVLLPGVFARVRIPLGESRPMLVVPGSALGNDQEGDFVLVVGANNIVARTSVVKGPLTENGQAIKSGLKADDQVIIRGLMNAKPGQPVAPVSGTAQ